METRSYINNEWTEKRKFTIIKDITFVDPKILHEKLFLLEKLQTEDFGKIKIPNYNFEQTGELSLRIISEYIKGRYANLYEMDIIEKYAIERINNIESEYSLSDYNPNNFIVDGKAPNELYCVDVDCYRKVPLDKRWERWNKIEKLKHERYQRAYNLD